MIKRILDLIDSSGMSDSAMCKELSIGNGIIGKWRKGLQKPSTDAIIKIAQYFQVSTDFILLGQSPDKKISFNDQMWLDLIHRLPEKKKLDFKSRIEGYLECYEESVAADSTTLERTGSDSLGK